MLLPLVRSTAFTDLAALWPEGSGFTLADISLNVSATADRTAISILYLADEEFPAPALEAFRLSAQRSLGVAPLIIEARRIPRTWGTMDLSRLPSMSDLKTWAAEVRKQAHSDPTAVQLAAVLRHPEDAPPARLQQAEASAQKALSMLAAGGWGQPLSPKLVPAKGSSAYTLTIVAEPSRPLPPK